MESYEDEDELQIQNTFLGFLIVAVPIYLCYRCCCKRCCKSCCGDVQEQTNGADAVTVDATSVIVEGQSVGVDFLRQPRSIGTVYVLWFFGGPFGAHHFFLGRLVHGGLAACSLNFCFMGWFMDFFLISQYVATSNSQTAPFLRNRRASSKSTCCGCGLYCSIMLASLVATAFNYAVWVQTPYLLERVGFLDIDGQLAGTGFENPYDILGVPRDTDVADVKLAAKSSAAKVARQRREELPGCDEKCKRQQKTLQQKALNYFKKEHEDREESRKKSKQKGQTTDVGEHIDRWADAWKAVIQQTQERAGPYFTFFRDKDSEQQDERGKEEL